MQNFEVSILFLFGAFIWFLCSVFTLFIIGVSVDRDRPQRFS
uniref:Uncharacterized protein n=1 Tax=Marseillevirus sp. TaxID=2809551 RepID=A0AA96J2V7_9VIRU|nr:hypothetical protein MarFTMF_014 [Marseillevirus sp.]